MTGSANIFTSWHPCFCGQADQRWKGKQGGAEHPPDFVITKPEVSGGKLDGLSSEYTGLQPVKEYGSLDERALIKEYGGLDESVTSSIMSIFGLVIHTRIDHDQDLGCQHRLR